MLPEVGIPAARSPPSRAERKRNWQRITLLTLSIKVENTGDDTLTNVLVMDALETAKIEGGSNTYAIDSLAAGEVKELTVTYTVLEVDVVDNKLTNVATAGTPNDPDGPEGQDEVVTPIASLAARKEASKTSVVAGETVAYTITVKNDGEVDFENLVISDSTLAGIDMTKNLTVKVDGAELGEESYSATAAGITLDHFQKGAVAEVSFDYTVPANSKTGKLNNVAIVTGTTEDGTQIEEKPSEEINVEEITIGLIVDKTADKSQAKAGEIITYTITVKNTGNTDYKEVAVTDQFLGGTIASGATITKVQVGDADAEKVSTGNSYVIPVLKAGETAVITAEYTVQESDNGTIINAAVAKGKTDDPEKNPEGGSDKVPTDVCFDLLVRKVWENDNILIRPRSIRVMVYKDGVPCSAITEITILGGWVGKFTVAKDSSVYTVLEEAVTGYTTTYSHMVDNTITITNTRKTNPDGGLIQTGQLNWPIPVLALLGVSMITGGVALTLRKRKGKYEV